ncbi:protein sbmA, partial [Escherichia coli]
MNNDGTALVLTSISLSSLYAAINVILSAYRTRLTFWYLNRPGFPGECFICELRLPDHRFRWKHNKLFLLLPEEYGPAFP